MIDDHNSSQRDYFRSADQTTIRPMDSPYVTRHLQTLIDLAGLTPGASVLEVGAGLGRFSALLHGRGFQVTASDISPELIDELQRHSPDVPAFVSDVNALPHSRGKTYDAVVGFFMLHHLVDLRESFEAMAAMLKPGGRLAFCEPNAWFFPFYLQILLTPRMSWRVDKGVMNMRRRMLTPALEACGFTDISYHGYGFLPPQIYNRSWGRRLDQGLGRLPIPARAKAFQVITASHG